MVWALGSFGPQGPHGSQLGPFPHKKKLGDTYIDFHDRNIKRIENNDMRFLWEW